MAFEILKTSFAAVQASVSVLLTILYGVLAAQMGYLQVRSARQVSRMSIKMLLPALLLTNLGSELHLKNLTRYVAIAIWAFAFNLISLGIGNILGCLLKLPRWVTPAIAFNNTASLPLLLLQSLGSTGVLSALAVSPGDDVSAIVERARSYFLISSVVGNTLTFGFGRELLGVNDEDPAQELDDKLEKAKDSPPPHDGHSDEESTSYSHNRRSQSENDDGGDQRDQEQEESGERASLLPRPVIGRVRRARFDLQRCDERVWRRLPHWMKEAAARARRLASPPVVGALVGVVLGLTPSLHRLFFADEDQGGYLNAWLTVSLKNIGQLFVSLQVIVVGVKLAQSLRSMERRENSGAVPWLPLILVIFVRFVLWPMTSISISVVWALVSHTDLLAGDPILWFTMMLMPVGPSAMKLLALAEVDGASEQVKMSIAKFLTISYMISPIISFAVVASLKVSDVLMKG